MLLSLGLTPWEARVYLAVLDLGESKAAAVADESRVPRGRVYDVLERLQEKGAAEIVPVVPRRFRAVPPEAFLERRTRELRLKAEELEKMQDLLQVRLVRPTARTAQPEGRIVLVQGRRAVVTKFRELLASASSEILGYTSEKCVVRQAKFTLPIYEERAKAGVDVRLAVNITPENVAAVKALETYVHVRHHGLGNRILTVLVIDARCGFLIHWDPDDEDLAGGSDMGVASEDAGFSCALRTMVLDRWEHSGDARARYGELAPVPGT